MGKICKLVIENDKCYYLMKGCTNDELNKIIRYKSWIHTSWKYGSSRKYFVFPYKISSDVKVVWSYIGFAPLLVRLLNSMRFTVIGKEQFIPDKKLIMPHRIYYKLWDFQVDAVNGFFSYSGCGLVRGPTGCGKSIIACEIIRRIAEKTLICVHMKDLLVNVWLDSLVTQFGMRILDDIGIIGGSIGKRERKRLGIIESYDFYDNINMNIVIATTQSLISYIDELTKYKFGLFIFDECHHAPAEQFKKVARSVRARYRLGLSATLSRPDNLTPMMYGLIGDVAYSIRIRELVNKGILAEPIFYTYIVKDDELSDKIDSVMSNIIEKKNKKKKYANYDRYYTMEVIRKIKVASASSTKKMEYVIKFIKDIVNNNKTFLLYTDYVNKTNKGIIVRDDYVKRLQEEGIRCFSISSIMDMDSRNSLFNMLREKEIDGIVFGKLGAEGINIPSVDCVVMANTTKSTILFPQRVGRAMRAYPGKRYCYVYEFILDNEVEKKWSKENFREYEVEGYKKQYIYLD